jgi:hypothetical protein
MLGPGRMVALGGLCVCCVPETTEIKFVAHLNKRQIVGWFAVGLSTAIACFWAMWGIIENFHEGWFHDSLLSNLGLMFVQYLSPWLILVALSQLSIYFPRVGSVAHAGLGLLLPLVLRQFNFTWIGLITLPLVLIGTLYWFGRPQPRNLAPFLVMGLSAVTLIAFGVGPAFRVAGRVNDGNLQARLIEGNGVRLIWAPDGPGWPRTGADWYQATTRCEHLQADGQALSPVTQSVWRLPTAEEAVRTMSRHGVNSGGLLNLQNREASYQVTPDKESPLWNIHSQIIYWWTATEVDEQNSHIIVYDGKVWVRRKQIHPSYLGFRCVRLP